jgi:hypothetical protein
MEKGGSASCEKRKDRRMRADNIRMAELRFIPRINKMEPFDLQTGSRVDFTP